MNNTYQLSQSGIERLERFKRDIEAGDFEISEGGYYSDGSVMYYHIENSYSIACCFDCDYSDVVDIALKQIKNTLSSGIGKNLQYDGKVFYYPELDGVGLNRTDITTPAQRALERMAKRINS